MDITYPEGVRVVPTEKVTVAPIVDGEDGIPAGAEFTIAESAEGFDAEVDEAGVVTISLRLVLSRGRRPSSPSM